MYVKKHLITKTGLLTGLILFLAVLLGVCRPVMASSTSGDEHGEPLGYASISVEAFTISAGYLVEPQLMPVYQGDTAEDLLKRVLEENGYGYRIENGYFSFLFSGTTPLRLEEAQIEENIMKKLESKDVSFPAELPEDRLGEFDFGQGSGWMFSVDEVFLSEGLDHFYVGDGQEIRFQYTVWYGADIGDSFAEPAFFTLADKTELSRLTAKINSASNKEKLLNDAALVKEITAAKQVLETLCVSQREVDEALEHLQHLTQGTIRSVLVAPQELTLEKQEVYDLEVSYDAENMLVPVVGEWRSSNCRVATVDRGRVTAVGPGEAVITGKFGDIESSCQVTVNRIPLESLQLGQTEMELVRGEAGQLSADCYPADTTDDKTVEWWSADPSVAEVDESGIVTGVSLGSTIIYAKAGDITASCEVTVKDIPVTKITLDKLTASVETGGSLYLTAVIEPENTTQSKRVLWRSSDNSIAEVRDGCVVGRKKGICFITAASQANNMEAGVWVRVIDGKAIPINNFLFGETAVSMKTGDKRQIDYTIEPQYATDPMWWKSSDDSVVRVSDGVLEAKREGNAIVTVSAGKQSKCISVTVKKKQPVADGSWRKDSQGWWYHNYDGTYPRTQWKQIGGRYYYFDKNGYMKTGWIKDRGKWYYLGGTEDGSMKTGWQKIGGKWYYLNGSGEMLTGWYQVGNIWYYSSASGIMQTGWQKIGGRWYYLEPSGAMATGWIRLSGKWYYLQANGAMASNTWIDGCYLNGSGAWVRTM